jgi:hypothetical protein
VATVLVCTDHEHQASICADFPGLEPHDILRKWLYIDSRHQEFEPMIEAVARRMVRNDARFGIVPQTAKRKRPGRGGTPRSRHS